MRELRIPGESDIEFRTRAERAAHYARILADAALANHFVRQFIADPTVPHTEESERCNPTVRVEYEQAIAIGRIGECLRSTRSKCWGDGPHVMPLESDDPVDPFRILYLYKEGSVYNRRFEQRRRMRELLGKGYRSLVTAAKYKHTTKAMFMAGLSDDQVQAISRILGIEPGDFWRAARGRVLLRLPLREIQLNLGFSDL
jgi:hypothetical protein